MSLLSKDLITRVLGMLDHTIGTSELLTSVAPIRIMVAGGTIAVMHLNTRDTTEDFDFILDPNIDAASDYRAEFFECAKTAAMLVEGVPKAWLNDHMRSFIRTDKRLELFLSSVDQGLVLFEGENLVVYATRLDWALESKLARIETLDADNTKRHSDIDDCVELIRLMNNDNSGNDPAKRVSVQYLRGLNFNEYKVHKFENGIAAVAKAYKEKYGQDGILF